MTEPTNTPDQPTGAIVNGREFARRLEANYDFQDLAGPLVRCTDWDELKACFEHLAAYCEHRPQPATASPVTVKPIKWTRIPSAYEMRSGKKKNWEARVDGVRIGQVEHPEDKAGYEERHRQRTLSYIQPEAPTRAEKAKVLRAKLLMLLMRCRREVISSTDTTDQILALIDQPDPAPQTVQEAARVLLSARPNIPENTMISKWLRALSEGGE